MLYFVREVDLILRVPRFVVGRCGVEVLWVLAGEMGVPIVLLVGKSQSFQDGWGEIGSVAVACGNMVGDGLLLSGGFVHWLGRGISYCEDDQLPGGRDGDGDGLCSFLNDRTDSDASGHVCNR